MSSSVNEANLEKKFQAVNNTQDSIQTLSLWILHHKAHHKKIVDIWMKVLKKAKINHRLTLFYLANDVIQNSRRKGNLQFGETFSDILREATLLVRDEHIRPSVERVFNIWEQRNIYEPDFISDLKSIIAKKPSGVEKVPFLGILDTKNHVTNWEEMKGEKYEKRKENKPLKWKEGMKRPKGKEKISAKVPVTAPSKLLAEFKCENVIEKMKEVNKLEVETTAKLASLNVNKLNATNAEILQQLKDRTHGQEFSCDFDEATKCLEDVIEALDKEIQERNTLILLLEQSEIYYDTQRGEAKIVATAYKNFGNRVKNLHKKLEEVTAAFPSPVPSPCPDAPSPSNSDVEAELSLPGDKMQTTGVDSLVNAPSPEGSPEGLALTPTPSDSKKNVGNPIPTLSNFFSQGPGMMSSWLGAFAAKSTPAVSSPRTDSRKNDSSSLDSRLSNLMQNIPNLPSGLQNTLFGGSAAGNSTPSQDIMNSPILYGKEDTPNNVSAGTEAATPVKDEYSGQNTPLQDEDTHSSNSAVFFTRLASHPKSSQSPKDILRGLTNLIQTATGDKALHNQKDDSWHPEKAESYESKPNISEFIKKIAPSLNTQVSPHSSSPSAFFNSPQHSRISSQVENSRKLSVSKSRNSTITDENISIHSSPYTSSNPSLPIQVSPYTDSRPRNQSYSIHSSAKSTAAKNIHQNLSYIPTLVPSTPHDGSFEFESASFSPDEYNPEIENFEQMDMELEGGELCSRDVPSPEIMQDTPASPEPEVSDDEELESRNNQRQSTLITVVTDDSVQVLDHGTHSSQSSSSHVLRPIYSTPDDIVHETTRISWHEEGDTRNKPNRQAKSESDVASDLNPTEETFSEDKDERQSYFTPNVPSNPEHGPSNGEGESLVPQSGVSQADWTLSKIETVQSHRKDSKDHRWFGKDWGDFQQVQRHSSFYGSEGDHYGRRSNDRHDYHHNRGSQQSNFHTRNNWQTRERHFSDYDYGPSPSKRFTPFSIRSRNWRKQQY